RSCRREQVARAVRAGQLGSGGSSGRRREITMSGERFVRWLGSGAALLLLPAVAGVGIGSPAGAQGAVGSWPAPSAVPSTGPSVESSAGPTLHSIVPARIMDTRSGIGTAVAPLGAGETRALQVVGQADTPAGAVAVALNVTVTEPTASSYLTVWPAGAAMPTASNVNVVAGQTVANMVTVGIGAGGQIDLYNFNGDAQVLVDVTGWYSG